MTTVSKKAIISKGLYIILLDLAKFDKIYRIFLTTIYINCILTINWIHLQGRVQFPTGGKAHEPQGMIR